MEIPAHQSKDVRTCEKCGEDMRPVARLPGLGGLPELWTYQCSHCGNVATEAVGQTVRLDDLIAPIDIDAFSNRAGEVIARAAAKRPLPSPRRPRKAS
jgi:hypothetical protein